MNKVKKYIRKGAITLKNEGVISTGIKALQKIQKIQNGRTEKPSRKIQYTSLVSRDDVMRANWSSHPYVPNQKVRHSSPYIINWIMSPPSSGGGHQNIFRFIEFLDKAGHKNNVYIYSEHDDMTIAQARDNVKAYCSAENLEFYRYGKKPIEGDVLFATGWETAYPVFNEKSDIRKMYFIQDFEPFFYPMGTDYILAENTYRFGFHGITAGGWLDDKLSREYNMQCDHYDFGADPANYRFTNKGDRKQIFFYARPVTERRGFDLGVMALQLFHEKMPDYEIVLAGWDVSQWSIPFPYTNLKTLKIEQLSDVYNQSAAALVLSLTNMSLLPLELLATGTIPIVNDGPNNRLVSDNPYINYTDASPEALAEALIKTVTRKDLPTYAEKASKSVSKDGWEVAGKKFISILEKELKNV
jgi:glycosyltransferase involved in cell wall biosynthesis